MEERSGLSGTRRFCFVLYLMVVNLGVTRVFHYNHRDVSVDEDSPQRSHGFSRTGGGGSQGSCSSGRGSIYAQAVLFNLKDQNFSGPEAAKPACSLGVKPKNPAF